MSRGPGKWQRTIIAALESAQWIYVEDLLPPHPTRAEYVALLRAARGLTQYALWWGGRKGRSGHYRLKIGLEMPPDVSPYLDARKYP